MAISRITGLEEGEPKKPRVSLITGNRINEGSSPIQAIGSNNMAVAGPELTDKEKFSNVLFHRDLTNEEVIDGRALAQDTSEKWKNGLAKAGVTFAGAMAENTLGIGAGLLNVMTGGSFFDTPLGQWVDGANEAMQEAFPNYETIAQSQNPWDVWSANFWADKVANGVGYSLAAMASVAVPLFPIAGGMRAAGIGRQAFLMNKQKAMATNLAKATAITKDGNRVAKELLETGKITKILEEVKGGLYTGTLQAERILGSAMAESNVEARELKNQMASEGGDRLLEFKREQARKANPNITDQELESITLNDEEIARIQSNSEMAGTLNYFSNLAVVGGSQVLMFGKLLRGKNPNHVPKTNVDFDKDLMKFNAIKDSKVTTFAKKLAGKEDLKGWEKLYIGVPTGAISEAGQEAMQFISKKTYGDFYTRKNTGEEVGLNELIEAASEAVVSAFTTKEGIESMLIGAIVGGGTKSMVDAVDFLRRKGKTEDPGNASEQLADKLNDMEDILYGLSKGDGNRELTNVQLSIARDMEKAYNEGDLVGAGYLYSQLIAANTYQAVRSNGYDAVRARIDDTREMTDEEFSKFFDLNKELTQEEKNELVDSVLKNMDENKEIYDTIERKFSNKTFKSGIVDGIIKKANPEFYTELEIWNAEMDLRRQNLYESLVSRRNIMASYAKMNEQLTNSAATNYRSGKVKGVTKETNRDEDETSIIEDLARNAPLNLTNTIFDKAALIELKKEFPAAYKTLIDLYKQKNPKAWGKNSVSTQDIQELLQEFSENPEFLDALTKLQNIDPKLDPMYFNYAAEIIQLAAIEAQLEFDYAMLNNDEITESLIAEDIKRKEATIKAIAEQVRGKENLSQINDRFKKDPTYQTAITDFNEELPEGATEKEVTDHYNKAIQHYKDIIDLVSEEEDYKYKASIEVYATKKINELIANKAKYLKELKENRDTNSGISLPSVDVLSKLIQNENYPEAQENFSKLSTLSNQEILDGLEIRLETWKGKDNTRPNDRQDGKVVQRYGVPGTNLGVYVYHNNKLIGGLMHPEVFTYNGQPFNYDSPQQMELLGDGLVETNAKGEKTFTEEGNAIRDFHIAITRAFVGVSEEGDTISSEAIQKLFKLHSKRWINNTDTPVEEREKLSEFMNRAFHKYKFTVGKYSNIWVVQDGQEFHAVYEDGTTELIEDNETLKEIRSILNSDEFGTQTKLYNTVKAIIKNGESYQYIAMNYNQVDTTAGKDILANMISRIKELESFTDEERKISGKEKALINTGSDKKVFFTTNRESGESVDIYLDASAFLNKDGSLRPKVVVKIGDTYTDFYFNIKVRNNKLIYGKYDRNPDGSTKVGSLKEAEITSIEDLTEAINDTIQSYVAKKPEEYSKLAPLVVYGLKESAKDNLLNNRIAGVPGFNFYLRPYNTPNTKQANAGKPKEMSAKRRKQIEDALKTTNETIAIINTISDRNLASRLTEIMASKLRQDELSEFPKALGRLQELLKYASEVEEEPINIEEFEQFVNNLENTESTQTTSTAQSVPKNPAEITPSTIFGTSQETAQTEEPSQELQEAKKSARAKVVTKRRKPNNDAPFSLTKKGTEVNLEEARSNVRKILGDSVPLEVVDGIAERLGLKGISASRFINGVIQLDRYAEKGTEYHEAFHAVFRTMLSNSEIAEMYKAAREKYGRFTSAQKKAFIAQEPNSRSKMDINELTNLWFEEKLADEFKDFMNAKSPSTKGFVARIFERILNFLKSLTGKNKDVITTLFDSMAKGEFVNAPQKYNVFRDKTDPAYTLLKTETNTETNINRPLHRTESNRIVADISARLYTKITNSGGVKYNSPEYKRLVVEAIEDSKEYYSIGDEENPGNWDKELDAYANLIFESDSKATKEERNRAFFEKADPIMKMFHAIPYVEINEKGEIIATEQTDIAQPNLDIILEEVKDIILFKMGVEVSSESYTEDEQEEQIIGESWSKAAYENGGYDRVGDKLRAIIQFSSAPLDEFGFGPSIIDMNNPKYHRPLHNTVIYNSIIRALINTPKDQMLAKFRMFTEGNSETRKFFEHMSNIIATEYNNKMKLANNIKQDKYFEEITALDVQNADEAFSVELAKHSDTLQVFQAAGKGTVLSEIDVLNDPTTGNMLTSFSSMRKLEDIQIKQWRNRFISENIDANTAVKSFSRILEYYAAFDPNNMGKSLEDFKGNVKRIVREFKQVGIMLSPTYVKYSLLKDNYKALAEGRRNLDAAGNNEGVEQITEFINFVDTFYEIPSINDGLNISDVKSPLVRLNQFAEKLANKRLFIYQFIDDSEGEGSSYDVTSRLLKLAEGNMAFDENITPTTYTNMEGKMVQSYTGSFYYSEQIAKLKDNSPGKFRDFMFGDNGLLSIKEKYDEIEAIPEEELNNLYDKLEQASIAVKNPLFNKVQTKSTLALLFYHPYIVQGSELFNYYIEILKIGQNGGGRNKSLDHQEDGSIKEQRARTEGVQYSSMTTRDKILYHAAIYKLQKTIKKGDNTVTQGNIMFGVNAEKSRQYHITAPIFDFTTEKTLAKDMIKQMFKAEVANIYLNNQGHKPDIKGVTYTTDGSLPNIERFHTMTTKDAGINASLANIAKLATEQSLTQIIADPNNTIDERFIDDLIQRIVDSKFNDFLQLLDKYNVINIKENEITTGVLPLEYIINPKEARGKVDIKTLNNWFLNDFINALGTNSLINLSSHLTSTKGAADAVKRFPTGSAQGNDMGSGNTNIIIFKSVEKNGIDTTDGIAKTHIGWFMNTFLKAEGTSDSKTLSILNNVRKGKKLTDEEYEYLYEKKAIPQSMKLQGNTALMALKMSVANILRSSVSYTEDQDTVDLIYDLIALLEINDKLAFVEYNGKEYTKEDLFEIAHSLFKPIPGSEDLHNALNRMESKNIGMAIADSAVKKAQIDAEELNEANLIYQFPNEYIRKQVESSGMKKEGIHPVQLQQLITSEIAKNAEIFIDGIKNSGEKTTALYKKLLSQRITTGFAEKRALLIDKFGKETYKYMLAQFQRTLSEMGASPYVEEMFSAKDSTMFEPKNDLNFPSIVSKFEALYISFFDKNVFKHYTNGSKFVLVPDYNYQVLTLNGKNISRDQYRAIKDKSKVKSRELAHRVKDSNGNFYSEVIVSGAFAKLFGLKIGDQIPENLMKFFGVRIPTQDKHSMINMKVVDFLDSAMGNTIIAPHQLVEISGWDFDIDSVYAQTLAGYNYKGEHIAYGNYLKTGKISDARQEYLAHLRENNVIVKEALKQGTNIEQILIDKKGQIPEFNPKQVEKNIKAYKAGNINNVIPITQSELNNMIMNIQIGLLHNDKNKKIAETPATRKIMETLKEMYRAAGLDPVGDITEAFSFANKMDLDTANATGAENIGVAATFNTMFQYFAGKDFKGDFKLFGQKGFKVNINEDGWILDAYNNPDRRLNDYISQLVTAMTDAGKHNDPAFFNITKSTLSIIALAMASGKTIEFGIHLVNQPIIKDYIIEKSANNDRLTRTSVKSDDKILSSLRTKYNIGQEISDISSMDIKVAEQTLFDNINTPTPEVQKYALEEFIKADDISSALINFTQVTSLLKGRGASFGEVSNLRQSVENLKSEEFPFDINDTLEDNPHLDTLIKMIDSTRDIDKRFVTLENEVPVQLMQIVRKQLNAFNMRTANGEATVRKHLQAFLTMKAMAHKKEHKYGMDLLFEPTLTNNIRTLLGTFEFEKNLFLNSLDIDKKSEYKEGTFAGLTYYNINMNTRSAEESEAAEKIIDHFVALRYSSNPLAQEVAEQLLEFLLIKDGFLFLNNSFVNKIEPAILSAMGVFEVSNSIRHLFSGTDKSLTYENTFGMSKEKLMVEFINAFTLYTGNKNLANKIRFPQGSNVTIGDTIIRIDEKAKKMNEVKGFVRRPNGEASNFTVPLVFNRPNIPLIYKLNTVVLKGKTYDFDALNGPRLLELIDEEGNIMADSMIYQATMVQGSKQIFNYYLNQAELDKYLREKKKEAKVTDVKNIITSKGTINVYWGQPESETSTRILSNLAPRKFIWEGREYGSVEHAYQSNKSGTFNKKTYDDYNSLEEIPNRQGKGWGRKIAPKVSVEQMKAADSLGLMKKLVIESFKQNSNSEAAKKLLQYENFTHNTNELIDKAFLEGLKLAQQELSTTRVNPETKKVNSVEKTAKTEEFYNSIMPFVQVMNQFNIGDTALTRAEYLNYMQDSFVIGEMNKLEKTPSMADLNNAIEKKIKCK